MVGGLSSFDTRAVWREGPGLVGQLRVSTAWGACTVLYSQPRAPPAIELVGFPGDGVPNGAWHPLLGAPGSHPHSGGMLSVLAEKTAPPRSTGSAASTPPPNTAVAVYVIEPESVRDGFALYTNFFDSRRLTAAGEPLGYRGRDGHAAAALTAALTAARAEMAERGAPPPLADAPLDVCGFSKGCVVLNQLLSELAHTHGGTSAAPPAADAVAAGAKLLSRLRHVHYVDAGLPARGAHPTDAAVAAKLGALGRPHRIFFHGTPRQWRDPSRPWLKEEMERAVAMLDEAGVPTASREYVSDAPLNLETHFRCVELFSLGL